MITDVQYALSWRKEATGWQSAPTRTSSAGISRLSPGSGKPLETFLAVSDGPGMYIAEEAWTVPPPSELPDQVGSHTLR